MTTPSVTTGMLIRRPVSEVFQAFTEPGVTSWFWFTHADRRLTVGSEATWTWGMYGFTSPVAVTAFEADRRLAVDWGEGEGLTHVEWRFSERGPDQTFVEVDHSGFSGDADAKVDAALDGMNGLALVLAGAKIWLAHGIEPRFVVDRMPDARVAGWEA